MTHPRTNEVVTSEHLSHTAAHGQRPARKPDRLATAGRLCPRFLATRPKRSLLKAGWDAIGNADNIRHLSLSQITIDAERLAQLRRDQPNLIVEVIP